VVLLVASSAAGLMSLATSMLQQFARLAARTSCTALIRLADQCGRARQRIAAQRAFMSTCVHASSTPHSSK
jgi:hypothetical protein